MRPTVLMITTGVTLACASLAVPEEAKTQKLAEELKPVQWLVGEFDLQPGNHDWHVGNLKVVPSKNGSALQVTYSLGFLRFVSASMSVREEIAWDETKKAFISRYEVFDGDDGWGGKPKGKGVDGKGEYVISFDVKDPNLLHAKGKFQPELGEEQDIEFQIRRFKDGQFEFQNLERWHGVYKFKRIKKDATENPPEQ